MVRKPTAIRLIKELESLEERSISLRLLHRFGALDVLSEVDRAERLLTTDLVFFGAAGE